MRTHAVICIKTSARAAVLAAALALPSGANAANVLTARFGAGADLPQCPDRQTARVTVQGPGDVTVTMTVAPYLSLGLIPNIPVAFWLVSPGRPEDFLRPVPLPGLAARKVTQDGHDVSRTPWADGAPLEVEELYRLRSAEQYVIDVRASPQCALQPNRLYANQAQEVRVAVSGAGGAAVTVGPASVAAAPELSPTVPPPVAVVPPLAPPPAVAPPSRPEPPQIVEIFSNGNIAAVDNGARRATTFTLDTPAVITKLSTYHWNYGRGRRPGTIALRSDAGELFGPWRANSRPGQGGVPNAYWIATPEVSLRPGTYTVLDSDPATWSQNGGSGGAGFASAEGYYE
jgi:hypothetical protein